MKSKKVKKTAKIKNGVVPDSTSNISIRKFQPLHLAGILTFFVALSFYRTPLVADEVFVTFHFGADFYNHPSRVFTGAVSAALSGFATGRFVSPITHFFSNFGILVEHVTHKVLQIDMILAHDIWRLTTTVLIVLTALSFLYTLFSFFVNADQLVLLKYLSAVLMPLFLVSNNAWGSLRLGVWSYNLSFIMVLLLMSFTLKRFRKAIDKRQTNFLLFVFIGLQFATLYELSQVLFFPFLFLLFMILVHFRLIENSNVSKKALYPNWNLAFLATGFIIPFLFLRIDSYVRCRTGCYDTASLTLNAFDVEKVVNRFFSGFPLYSITYNKPNLLESTQTLFPLLIGIAYICTVVIYQKKYSLFAPGISLKRTHLGGLGFPTLLLYPLFTLVFISVGMGLSVAVQNETDLTLTQIGKSSRDTSYATVFWAILFIVLAFTAINYASDRLKHSNSIFFLSKLGALFLVLIWILTLLGSNYTTSKTLFMGDGVFLQSRIATELQYPDLTVSGNDRRCSLVVEKINDYPEWEGHDRTWLYGANLVFEKENGRPFCDIPADVIFQNYGKP
jgi:hypothetical protein